MRYPKWATPERRRQLEKLLQHPDVCPVGDRFCPVQAAFAAAIRRRIGYPQQGQELAWIFRAAMAAPGVMRVMPLGDLFHLPWCLVKILVEDWKADDRLERSIAWEREKRRLHAAPLKKLWRRGDGYDAIARDIHLANRSQFRILKIGVNAFTQQRIAKVEIPGLEKIVWVTMPVRLSKNRLRKLFRRPQGEVPEEVWQIIQRKVGSYL